jgi:metal-responsive CopG/Arc/MetJ family transcriptional regulator
MDFKTSETIHMKNIPSDLVELLDIISENQYEKRANMMRKFLRVITEQYPSEMKSSPNENKPKRILLNHVNPQVKKDLENIAAHLGVGMTDLIKMDLRKMIDQLPDDLKIPNSDD